MCDELYEELDRKLNRLSDDFKNQTQEEYLNDTNVIKMEKELFPVASKIGGDIWTNVQIIYYNSRMAENGMISLALELLASNIYMGRHIKKNKV